MMGRFHDVSIYWGNRLLTTSTRLEVAARSPYLLQLLTSITVCDGCKEPTALIFPEEDETQNTLKEVFKSLSVRTGQSRYSIVESPQSVSALKDRLGETGGAGGGFGLSRTREVGQGGQASRDNDFPPDPEPSHHVIYGNNDLIFHDIHSTVEVKEESLESRDEGNNNPAPIIINTAESSNGASNMEAGGGGEGNDNEVPGDAEGEGSRTRQREEEDEEEDWSEQRCGLCGESGLQGKEGLYRHYAYQHYKSRLFELLGENKKECPFCEHQFEFMAEIPGHIGYHHSKVEDFLPEHLRGKDLSLDKKREFQFISVGIRDNSSCGLCEHEPFAERSQLYIHYSISHFSRSLKQFIEGNRCTICGYVSQKKHLVRHVGVTHGKVDQFLDPSLRVPKGQKFDQQKSSDHECNLCQKKFSSTTNLQHHLAKCHFKEELKKFLDEDQLKCGICNSKFSNIHHLRAHVGIVHSKLDEVMEQKAKIGNKQSSNPLALNLSDEDPEEPEINQGHVNEYEEALELQFNREDYSTDEEDDGKEDLKDSRKRLRKSEKGSKVGSQAKKRKIVLSRQSSFLTSVKIQDQVKSPKDDDEVSISTKKSNQSKDGASREAEELKESKRGETRVFRPGRVKPSLGLSARSGLSAGTDTINYDVSFRNKTKTREERKMGMKMKAIEAIEKKRVGRRKDSGEKGKSEEKRGRWRLQK